MRFGARSAPAGFGRGGDGISRTKKTTAATILNGRRGKKKAALAGGFFLFLFGMAETLHALAIRAGHAVKGAGAGVIVAVVARDVLAEGRVAEVGPVVLVEAGRVLEQGFVDIEHGAVVGGVEGEGVEGDG